ncbi:hypothetical protein QHF83_53160, partial [Polyangium sp. 15x6]
STGPTRPRPPRSPSTTAGSPASTSPLAATCDSAEPLVEVLASSLAALAEELAASRFRRLARRALPTAGWE